MSLFFHLHTFSESLQLLIYSLLPNYLSTCCPNQLVLTSMQSFWEMWSYKFPLINWPQFLSSMQPRPIKSSIYLLSVPSLKATSPHVADKWLSCGLPFDSIGKLDVRNIPFSPSLPATWARFAQTNVTYDSLEYKTAAREQPSDGKL